VKLVGGSHLKINTWCLKINTWSFKQKCGTIGFETDKLFGIGIEPSILQGNFEL
jgi:hypothetical protein